MAKYTIFKCIITANKNFAALDSKKLLDKLIVFKSNLEANFET